MTRSSRSDMLDAQSLALLVRSAVLGDLDLLDAVLLQRGIDLGPDLDALERDILELVLLDREQLTGELVRRAEGDIERIGEAVHAVERPGVAVRTVAGDDPAQPRAATADLVDGRVDVPDRVGKRDQRHELVRGHVRLAVTHVARREVLDVRY